MGLLVLLLVNKYSALAAQRHLHTILCGRNGPGPWKKSGDRRRCLNADPDADLTVLLNEARSTGDEATDRLIRAIYGPLGRIARSLLRREGGAHSLHSDDLVQEALIRLVDSEALQR